MSKKEFIYVLKQKNSLNKVAPFMVALCLMFLFGLFPIYSHANSDEDLIKPKVAFPMIKSVNEIDASGTLRGYNYDYLQELSIYRNVDYIFQVESYENAVEKLKTGELDLMGYVRKDAKTSEYLNFSKRPAGVVNVMLVTDEYSTRFSYNDYDSIKNARVGVLRNSIYGEQLERFQKENNINLTTFEYNDESSMRADLTLGRIDCVLVSTFDNLSRYQLVSDLGQVVFYFGVSKNSPNGQEILRRLDESMLALAFKLPDYTRSLTQEYQNTKPRRIVTLTPRERKYLARHKEITVAFSPNWLPISYYESAEKQRSGLVVSMLKKIEDNTGIKFRYKDYPTYYDAIQAVKRGEVDIIGAFESEVVWAKEQHIVLTEPYISTQVLEVRNPKAMNNIVALPKGFYSDYRVKKLADDKEVRFYKSIGACLQAVNLGNAEYSYLNKYALEITKNSSRYPNAIVNTHFVENRQLCIGINEDSAVALRSILNKALLGISSDEMEDMLITAKVNAENTGITSWLKKHPYLLLLIEILVGLAFASLAIFYRIYVDKRDKRLNYNEVSGIWNLKQFQRVVNLKLKREKPYEYKDSYALVHIDIAKFKFINDIYGFKIGDNVLMTVGKHLNDSIKPGEYAGSLWADHFVLFLIEDGRDELELRVERIFEELTHEIMNKLDYKIVFRAGAYFIKKNDIIAQIGVEELIKNANYALGTIEENYRTNFICYTESMAGEIENTRLIYRDMMLALHEGSFTPYYQAKYDIYRGKLIGAEVLVRWIHPVHGMIRPDVFVPHLEKSGFIIEVDFQMFEIACENLQKWMEDGFEDIVISTNFSRRHLKDKRFVRKLTEISDRYNIPRNKMEIEITESLGEYGKNLIVERVAELRKAGYRVSIDDFGSGYSSISLLQSVRVDVIKLDRQFLLSSDMMGDDHKVMESIVKLVKDLNMEVLCEGVETQEQVNLLKNVGCKYAQGYYYKRPVSESEFFELMKKDC